MLFNSSIFLLFLVLFLAFWPLCRAGARRRWGYLVFASFVFYGWWDWRFLFVLLASALLDFFAARGMQRRPAWRRPLLWLSVAGNLGSLAVFKYSAFVFANLDSVLARLGYETQLASSIPNFFLLTPVGISFYTFQSMSYTIDVYRGRLEPTRHFLHFLAYVSLFPQLVAGPIERARNLLPQLAQPVRTTDEDLWVGLRLVAQGYFKKVVLADNLGPVIDAGFGALVPAHSTFYWWFIVTAFAFQIYCDFSGYSDIARGLARWMGYRFELNFDRPYSATSLRAFWGRWHISLSTWFRDYVYVPLGGSREGQHRAHLNMWATMLLSGFWHGAAWTFVIWGALHAFFLSLERLTRWPLALARARPLAIAVVLLQVWVAWVFFRASDVRQAVAILRIMFSFEGPSTFLVGGEDAAVFLLVGVLMEVVSKRHPEGLYQPPSWMGRWAEAAGVVAMLVAAVFLRGPGQAFIYFQF